LFCIFVAFRLEVVLHPYTCFKCNVMT